MAVHCLHVRPPSSALPETAPFPIVRTGVPQLIPIGFAWITWLSHSQSLWPEEWGALVDRAVRGGSLIGAAGTERRSGGSYQKAGLEKNKGSGLSV